MIPVDVPYAPWALSTLLVALLTVLVWRALTKDRREYQRFKRYRTTTRRQALYRKWLRESFIWFGVSALIVLVLVWGFVPRMLEQVETWPAMVAFRSLMAESGLASGLVVGGAIGLLIGALVLVFLGRNATEVPTIGDIHALLPRNRAELKFGWLLSINAGVVEELLFRLAMPVLIFSVFDDALLAISVSLVMFGLLHIYQGVPGMVGSFVIGTVLMVLFLATGNIFWPILVHAVFDLRSLVLIPMIVYRVHLPESERPTAASVPAVAAAPVSTPTTPEEQSPVSADAATDDPASDS